MSNFTWDSSPEIHLKSIQDLKQKYNRHYMRTLEKMTSHSAKIPIKSLAEYCFLLAAGIVKHQKRSKYIYKTSCCCCRSAVRCSASSHRGRADSHPLQVKHWQGISTSQTSHQKTPTITSRDQYKKKCVCQQIYRCLNRHWARKLSIENLFKYFLLLRMKFYGIYLLRNVTQ